MKILPAIDLLAGRAVRLLRGDYQQSSDYGEPPEAARRFAQAGAKRLHLVDLDGARDGQPANLPAVRAVASACKKHGVKIQLGGGIRNLPAVRSAIAAGADRVVLGTAAVRDPAFRNAAIAAFPEKIILALDARDGELALQGWRENSGVHIQSFLNELRENPPAAILHTDIARDGAMAGVNISQTREVCESAPCPVIASGGVSSVDDLRALAQIPNLAAAIVGRAFYNGALNPETVLAEFKNNNGSGDTVDNDSGLRNRFRFRGWGRLGLKHFRNRRHRRQRFGNRLRNRFRFRGWGRSDFKRFRNRRHRRQRFGNRLRN